MRPTLGGNHGRGARRRQALATAIALAVALTTATATAFDPATTHPGLTGIAALESRLHRFLRHDQGLDLGVFMPLALDPDAIDRRVHALLFRKLERMDPAGGYRPDDSGRQRAIGWLLAGSVLADMPATSNRNHYYNPVLKRGLDNRALLLDTYHGLLGTLEGGDSLREFLTASGFDLSGRSALDWIGAPDNPQSVTELYRQLERATVAPTPKARRHALTLAMLALGGLLNVLQDMATPSQVRDDFIGARTRRLGNSGWDRGSGFERAVAIAYQQFGVPAYRGKPIARESIRGFFSNGAKTGLADITSRSYFSDGTLPAPIPLPVAHPDKLHARANRSLRLPLPRVGPVDLACARRGTCYQQGRYGPVLAYRVDPRRQRLRFFLDRRCLATAARHLLPLAAGFSTGLIDHILRGRLVLRRDRRLLTLTNAGPAIVSGEARLLWQDRKGRRRILRPLRPQFPIAPGARLARVQVVLPDEGGRVLAVVTGKDEAGDPLIAVTQLAVATTAPASPEPAPKPEADSQPADSQPADSEPAAGQPASEPGPATPETTAPGDR